MKFKIDENLPAEVAAMLGAMGFDADTVHDERLAGAQDPVVVAAAAEASRVLLTLDKGIANLEEYPAGQHGGVVLFRPPRSGRGAVMEFLRERLPELIRLDLQGRLTVVGPTRIRIR